MEGAAAGPADGVAEPRPKSKKPKAAAASDSAPKRPAPRPAGGGYNWSAIFILFLFSLGPVIFGATWLYDKLYPEAALKARKAAESARRADAAIELRKQLEKCYTAANPKKLKAIDGLVAKYSKREEQQVGLWAKLYETYPVPECCNLPDCTYD